MSNNPAYMPLGVYVRRILVLGALALTAVILWQLRVVILMLFLAIIIAISLDVPMRRLQERGFTRGLAMLVVTIITGLFLVTIVLIVGSPLVIQTQALFDDLPEAFDSVAADYADLSQRNRFLPDIDVEGAASDAEQSPGIFGPDFVANGASILTDIGVSAVSAIINFVLVIIVALYLLAEPETYANSFLSLIPKSHQVRMLKLMIDLREALVSWLVAQLISMTIIGALTGFALGVILGIPNAFALGMFAGVMTIIPNFGTVIAMIPAIIFALADSPTLVLPVIATYLIVQQIESNLIMPIVVKQRLSVPAAALLVFQVIASVLLGFMGLLLAVPMFMVIKELVRALYVDEVLNNINTAIEARATEEGQTVVRITSDDFKSDEIPLRRIFKGADPFDEKLKQIVHDSEYVTEEDMFFSEDWDDVVDEGQ